MNKELKRISVITAALAVVIGLGAEVASAESGSSGAWPAAFPLPTAPGTVISQTSTTAVVRSTDQVAVVLSKLDNLYVTQKGCTLRLAVNRPKDYLCYDPATRKTDEIYFTFAALDPRPTDPSRSQTNAFSVNG
jgi:hypothetical protein